MGVLRLSSRTVGCKMLASFYNCAKETWRRLQEVGMFECALFPRGELQHRNLTKKDLHRAQTKGIECIICNYGLYLIL